MPNPTIPDLLFQHARRLASPFLSHEGLACALTPTATLAHDAQPIRSELFREWLARTFQTEHDLFASRHALRSVIAMLAALATDPAAARRSIDLRVSSTGSPLRPGSILLDLANANSEAVEITPGGWRVDTPPAPFRRGRAAQSLPHPERSLADAAAANQPLALPGFGPQPACLAWLLAALRPAGPYPILILQGPHACGKTLLARMLRSLVDPAASSVCRPARNQRDLLRLAWNNYVLVFDHVTAMPADIADSLCRLSSGAGFAFDEQTDGSDALVRLQRPIILTTPRCDSAHLRNRAIVVDLPAIRSRARRGEIELINEFFDAQPRILGRICNALSRAMSAAPVAAGDALPAFFDAAAWAIAAAPALGISEDRMRAALTADPFARDLAAFFHEAGRWEGTASELYAVLKSRGAAQLPATPARLSRRILSASWRAHGIHIEHAQTHSGRRIRATVGGYSTVATAHAV